MTCIFCSFESYDIKALREHSAVCERHPLWKKLAEARKDRDRLTALEDLVARAPGGLLIHHQQSLKIAWARGAGLVLSHRRTLRDAIDQTTAAVGDTTEADL